jgi:LPXTG-site transpeptidase (sortase) family protein
MDRRLAIAAIILAAFDVLIWHDVLTNDAPAPVARESIAAPVRVAVSGTPAAVAVEKVAPVSEVEAGYAPHQAVESDRRAVGGRPGTVLGASAVAVGTGTPTRLVIPSIAVDATVEKVALAADGSMDVPRRSSDAAWYSLGPRPGEAGSATVTGHFDSPYGGAAVFADLHKVKPGDAISVEDDTGAVTRFTVRKTRRYDAAADATDVFTSSDGGAHLNLITCVGAWDKRAKQYAERLVVFTDKEAD